MDIALVYVNSEANVGRGVGYILGALEAAGHRVAFFDTHRVPPGQVVERVVGQGFDLLMVSTMTLHFPQALAIAHGVKAGRSVPVLMGGVHPTVVGPRLLADHPEIDYLCIGEGETMATEFCRRWGSEALFTLPNLVYRRDGGVVANPLAPPEDLAALPDFPWQRFHPDSVVQRGQGFLYVTATRGCPYNCTYCCNGVYLKHYGRRYLRFRPVERVVAEMGNLQRVYRPGLFYFGDEMIMADPAYADELFAAVRRNLGVAYGCMIRVEHATARTARMLARTGCRYVAMGIECGDENFRRRFLNRHMGDEAIVAGFRNMQAAGIFTTAFNMIGYPVDDDDALTAATYRLNRRVGPDYAQVSVFYPFPGTRLHDYCVRNDLIDPARVGRCHRYYEESVLRGRSIQGRRRALLQRLNPNGFRFPGTRRARPATQGLRLAIRPVAAAAGRAATRPGGV